MHRVSQTLSVEVVPGIQLHLVKPTDTEFCLVNLDLVNFDEMSTVKKLSSYFKR
jgi:hypothetical protein